MNTSKVGELAKPIPCPYYVWMNICSFSVMDIGTHNNNDD